MWKLKERLKKSELPETRKKGGNALFISISGNFCDGIKWLKTEKNRNG